MSESKPVVTWTCDRCGATETRTMGEQPKGWLGVILASPPKRDVNDILSRFHYCPDCDHSFAEWLQVGLDAKRDAARVVLDAKGTETPTNPAYALDKEAQR